MRARPWLAITLVAALHASTTFAAAPTLTVFAAASLTDVMEQIGAAFTAETSTPVRTSFAASSALARQIESGAPAHVFVSADQAWMDYLVKKGRISIPSQRTIAGNSLVLVAPVERAGHIAKIETTVITAALGSSGRLSMGDPESVPAGRYGREALQNLGIWPAVSSRIIPADNVRTALNFVARGEAPLGIVYATDAKLEPRVKVVASFPQDSHAAIVYPAAAVLDSGPQAEQFLRFLDGPVARDLLQRAGFLLPTSSSPGD